VLRIELELLIKKSTSLLAVFNMNSEKYVRLLLRPVAVDTVVVLLYYPVADILHNNNNNNKLSDSHHNHRDEETQYSSHVQVE
jgi:hypothetical protein